MMPGLLGNYIPRPGETTIISCKHSNPSCDLLPTTQPGLLLTDTDSKTLESRYSVAALALLPPLVPQKVASELHPKVRNHGEGPY